MSVDGQRIVADVAPVTTVGQAYLPIRAISEATGGMATFDESTRTISVRRGSSRLTMRLGERVAFVNGKRVLLSHAPFTVRGRAMVPSSIIADAFGSSVRYDAREAKVDVRTPGVIVAPFPDDAP
jgi:serine protease Do